MQFSYCAGLADMCRYRSRHLPETMVKVRETASPMTVLPDVSDDAEASTGATGSVLSSP
jgi:hypothetical protein